MNERTILKISSFNPADVPATGGTIRVVDANTGREVIGVQRVLLDVDSAGIAQVTITASYPIGDGRRVSHYVSGEAQKIDLAVALIHANPLDADGPHGDNLAISLHAWAGDADPAEVIRYIKDVGESYRPHCIRVSDENAQDRLTKMLESEGLADIAVRVGTHRPTETATPPA